MLYRKGSANDIANVIKEYSQKYDCTYFQAALDMDHPVSAKIYQLAFEILGSPLTTEELIKISDSEDRVNEFWSNIKKY